MIDVRKPAVAGSFYPNSAEELLELLNSFKPVHPVLSDRPPKAIIAPHAGLIYSGPIAASVFARLAPGRETIHRVILLGPSHHLAFAGIAAPTSQAFDTPLGRIPLDRETIDTLAASRLITIRDDAHRYEHALEVELPFLQRELTSFHIVPLVIGDATYKQVANVLRETWGGDETLIVISSDLSHYYSYDDACRLDERTAMAIEGLDPDAIGAEQACGRIGIQALLSLAKEKHLQPERVDLRNSGDTAGPRDQVVGYGAFALSTTGESLSP